MTRVVVDDTVAQESLTGIGRGDMSRYEEIAQRLNLSAARVELLLEGEEAEFRMLKELETCDFKRARDIFYAAVPNSILSIKAIVRWENRIKHIIETALPSDVIEQAVRDAPPAFRRKAEDLAILRMVKILGKSG